jgi:hypothetical protein
MIELKNGIGGDEISYSMIVVVFIKPKKLLVRGWSPFHALSFKVWITARENSKAELRKSFQIFRR